MSLSMPQGICFCAITYRYRYICRCIICLSHPNTITTVFMTHIFVGICFCAITFCHGYDSHRIRVGEGGMLGEEDNDNDSHGDNTQPLHSTTYTLHPNP